MRAMRAEEFTGYKGLKLVDLPKPVATGEKILLRIAAAGVTPLDYTILSGQYPRAKAPLVLGGEGAAVVEDGGGSDFPVGSRVMFAGPYGVSEDGAYGEWLAVRKEHICVIPEAIDDVTAAGVPVAYLTAHISLTLAGFEPGKTVLAPAIGGSVGNAVTQLARALGAKHAISSTTNHDKAEQAKALGEVGAGMQVGMVKAKPRRTRTKGDAPYATSRDKRRSLLHGAVHISRQELPVPMQLFRCVSVIPDVDDHAPSLGEAQQRAGELAIIDLGRDDRIRPEFDEAGPDADRKVRRPFQSRSRSHRRSAVGIGLLCGLGLESGPAGG